MHVQRLRTKLGEAGKLIETVRGLRLPLPGHASGEPDAVKFAGRLVLGTVSSCSSPSRSCVWTRGAVAAARPRGRHRPQPGARGAPDPRGAAGRYRAGGATRSGGSARAERPSHHAGGPRAARSRGRQRLSAGPLPPIENHAGRPEIRAALTGGAACATPAERDRRPAADVRRGARRAGGGPGRGEPVARWTTSCAGRSGAVVGAALAGAARRHACSRCVAGRSIAQPLTDITAAARAIAAGSPPRFPRSGIPDIDAWCRRCGRCTGSSTSGSTELRREQAESAALVESMVEGVIAADGRGRIVTANPAARRLLGLRRGRAAARPRRAVPGQGGPRGGGRRAARASRCRIGSSTWTAARCW